MNRLLEIVKRINKISPVAEDVDLREFSTFKTGGTGDYMVSPNTPKDASEIFNIVRNEDIPYTILGGGANVLISDRGIRGIIISTLKLNRVVLEDEVITADAGITVNRLCEIARDNNLSGLEFLYGMPGTLGGALYMNARCYGNEVSEPFIKGEYYRDGFQTVEYNKSDWAYKKSPFQMDGILITKGSFKLTKDTLNNIQLKMDENIGDRRSKGHFRYPCAGSVFKNNRAFGSPTGKIMEETGLKGLKKGDAMISDFHGNIIINCGNATSFDINYLIEEAKVRVKDRFGFDLEPEVIKIGEW